MSVKVTDDDVPSRYPIGLPGGSATHAFVGTSQSGVGPAQAESAEHPAGGGGALDALGAVVVAVHPTSTRRAETAKERAGVPTTVMRGS